MKKIAIFTIMLILVLGCIFAGDFSLKTSLGYDLSTYPPSTNVDHRGALDVGLIWAMAQGYEANTTADLFVDVSFQTNFNKDDVYSGDTFIGAGVTQWLSDSAYTTLIFGFDTLWKRVLTCGPGLYVDFGFMCDDHFSIFTGCKVMHIVANDVTNDAVNIRATLGGSYTF